MQKLLITGICSLIMAACSTGAIGRTAVSVDVAKPIGPANPIRQDFAQGGENNDLA